MAQPYRSVTIEAATGQLGSVVRSLRERPAPGQVAVFGAQIGWPATEVRVLVEGDAGPEVDEALVVPGSLQHELLVPTARPVGTMVVPTDGICAHRWFELRPGASVDDFVQLSVAAWDAGFETLYDAHPLGLFAGEARVGVGARLLLITRYGSLADWSESRGTASATDGQAAEVGRHLAARRELTARTWVCTSVRVA